MGSADNIKKLKMDVAYVAKLARIALTDKDIKLLGKQLDDILDYIGKLKEVDTKTTEPTSHVLPLKNVYRNDEVKPSFPLDEVLKNAPSKEAGFFKVPKVIE